MNTSRFHINKLEKFKLDKLLLYALLAITFLLSIKQMLPFDSVDEGQLMHWIRRLHHEPFPALNYPPMFLYLHYALSWIYGAFLSLIGVIDNSAGFVVSSYGFRFTMEAGRVVSALLGTMTVYMAYRMGKDFYNRHAGFLAALLLAVNHLFILYAHIFKPEILLTFLLTLSLYYLLKYLHNQPPQLKYILWSSFFFGLAMAAKFNVFSFFFVILLAVIWHHKKWTLSMLYIPLCMAAGFLSGAPNWLIRPIGNFKAQLQQYTPESGDLFHQFESRSAFQIYTDFPRDFIEYFGIAFFIILIISLVYSFIRRDKKDISIPVFIIIYILLFAIFGYYAERFALPLFPAAALLIGKFVFYDLPRILKNNKTTSPARKYLRQYWKYAVWVLWIPILIYGAGRGLEEIKTYNLFKTQTRWDRVIEYRRQHGIEKDGINVGRQIFTPRIDSNNIKITKHFQIKYPRHERKNLDFIQAHRPTYNDYISGKKLKSPETMDLSPFRPFYEIRKRNFQPFWNPETVFLYRVPDSLAAMAPVQRKIALPRTFYPASHTIFLPLQTYEKNPGFGELEKDTTVRWLYSTEKIEKINITFFSLRKKSQLLIDINGKQFPLNNDNRKPVETIEMNDFPEKSFYYDYVYRLSIHSPQRRLEQNPYYFVIQPQFAGKTVKPNSPLFPAPVGADIPALFSNQPIPPWVQSFYKETGIDLSLLTYLNTQSLDMDTHETASPDIFPLEKGVYKLHLETGPISPQQPTGKEACLEILAWGPQGGWNKKTILTGSRINTVLLEINQPLCFVKIHFAGLRENNIDVKRILLLPDYRGYIGEYMVK